MIMTEKQLKHIAINISLRRNVVARELQRAIARARDESFVALSGPGNDPGDLPQAALIAEIGNAEVDRRLGELQQLADALKRISAGRYGVCVECGNDIAYKRLRAQPTAKRCLDCQRVCEHTRSNPNARRL